MYRLCLLACVYAVSISAAPQYELDQNKLQQRYDIIMGIVTAGLPGTQGAYKPKPQIGYAQPQPKPYNYGQNKQPNLYNVPKQQPAAYNPYTQQQPQAYNPYQQQPTAYNQYQQKPQQVYNPYQQQPQTYNPYRQQTHQQQQHHQQAKPYSGYPAPYGYSGGYAQGSRAPTQAAEPSPYANALKGLRLGGGQVHPLFNNDNLYVNTNPFGDYNTKDPIYINGGGGSLPQANLYPQGPGQSAATAAVAAASKAGNTPAGSATQVNAYPSATVGGKTAYTANPQGLYGNLPGYTNPYFNQQG